MTRIRLGIEVPAGLAQLSEVEVDGVAYPVGADRLVQAEVAVPAGVESLVFVDPLTGAYNRSYFEIQMHNEIARAQRDRSGMGDTRAVMEQKGIFRLAEALGLAVPETSHDSEPGSQEHAARECAALRRLRLDLPDPRVRPLRVVPPR